ncbi:hypothetical protein H4Q26_004070 [Puccinia striiformis f. sp. tritici PST-130]|nr:hypothetical protein H4Q26_004070 [Puccinia striiformis f. sp. tritici PST-130]
MSTSSSFLVLRAHQQDKSGPSWARKNLKLFDSDILSSPYPEARMICQVSKTSEVSSVTSEAIDDRLSNLAEEAANLDVQTAKLDPWLRHFRLDTRLASLVLDACSSWDQQYWINYQKSNDNPSYFGLAFAAFPLYRSRQHGWVFRISLSELEDPYLSRKPLSFSPERDPIFFNDQDEAVFFKMPHPDGESENVGSPLSKSFDKAFENEVLRANPLCIDHLSANMMSDSAHGTLQEADSHALADNARQALSMNMQCSYWLNASQRIRDQMVVWESSPTQRESDSLEPCRLKPRPDLATGYCYGDNYSSCNPRKPGYAIVGADVDSEELWISSVMGDAQFGMHDLHSKTASILGISRNDAKVFNYSRIYGAGNAHAVQLLMKADPTASKEEATKLARQLYASTKGVKIIEEICLAGSFGISLLGRTDIDVHWLFRLANLWTRCQFAFKLEMDDLPQSCAWFSAVDVDHVLRKEVDLSCVTPSNPDPIPPGESLDIINLLKLAPAGLGELKKPLEVTASSASNYVGLSSGNGKPSKHRSTQLEWLAAQSSQDRDEIRKHWHHAQRQEEEEWFEHELRQRAPPAPQVHLAALVLPSIPPSLAQLCSQNEDDSDMSAWKAFDASQPVHHPLNRL